MPTITTRPEAENHTQRRSPREEIEAARTLLATDRARGLAALNDLFRSGTLPSDLDGPLTGVLVTATLATWPDTRMRAWADRDLPWLGKRFTPAGGDNLWLRWPGVLDTVFWKMNGALGWQAVEHSPRRYRTFPFRTAVGQGVADPDRTVLKIIYDARPNPFPVRRVLDELIALGDGVYLGKAYGRLARRWRLLAYFALMESAAVDGAQE